MKSKEFIDALYDAGWRPSLDAQYNGIMKLWESIFPDAALLEKAEDALDIAILSKQDAENERRLCGLYYQNLIDNLPYDCKQHIKDQQEGEDNENI